MYISPISPISPLTELTKQSGAAAAGTDNTFKNLLNDMITNVNETDKASSQDIMNIASGNTDDLHTLTINSEKAELAVLTAVQVRNKVLEAYNEIMRVTL